MKVVWNVARVAFVVLVVVLIIVLFPTLRGLTAEKILNYTPASLPLAALVLVGIYGAKCVLMLIPTYGLYIAGGMLFPVGWAIVIGYVGLALEMSLGYLLGRWLGHDKVVALMHKRPKARRLLGFLSGNSQVVCFITRLLPMPYPVDLGSMFFGASGMGFWRHLAFSLLGFSAVMIPFTIAGEHISTPLSSQFLVPFGISLGIAGGLFAVYAVWQKRRERATAASTPADEDAAKPA